MQSLDAPDPLSEIMQKLNDVEKNIASKLRDLQQSISTQNVLPGNSLLLNEECGETNENNSDGDNFSLLVKIPLELDERMDFFR